MPATADHSLRQDPNGSTSHSDLPWIQGYRRSFYTQRNTLEEDSEESEDITMPSPLQLRASKSYPLRSGSSVTKLPVIGTRLQKKALLKLPRTQELPSLRALPTRNR